MKRRANQGMAIISALGFLAITVIFVGTAMMIGVSSRRQSADNYATSRAQFAAEAGIERALQEVYTNVIQPEYNVAGRPAGWRPTIQLYKSKLDTTTIAGELLTTTNADGVTFPSTTLPDGTTYDVTVTRADSIVGGSARVTLTITSTGRFGTQAVRRISQQVSLEAARLNTAPFAVLSNNVNCIFCHTTVTSIEAAYRTGTNAPMDILTTAGLAEVEGTSRVRVATLESLNPDRAVDSVITGTIYTRGVSNLLQKGGVKTIAFQDNPSGIDNVTLKKGNASGTDGVSFVQKDCQGNSAADKCPGFQNFYTNYPKTGGVDGELPEEFPLPVEDTNKDRTINDSEWKNALQNDQDRSRSFIKGSNIQFMATSTFGARGTSLVSKNNVKLAPTDDSDRGIAGNLVIKGDFELEGTVYVDGDVVISGKMKGNGKILARGNIYVVGDVEYKCSSTCDYSKPETLPKFAMVAGGNMLIGAYATTGNGDMSWNQTYEGCATHNETRDITETRTEIRTVTKTAYRDEIRYKDVTYYQRQDRVSGVWVNKGAETKTNPNYTGTNKRTLSRVVQEPYTVQVAYQTQVQEPVQVTVVIGQETVTIIDEYCKYTKGTKDYGAQFFDKVIKDTTNKSPEFVDPGEYLPFYDPANYDTDKNNSAYKATMLKYFGTETPSLEQRRSYARATFVKGDNKGGNGYLRTRGSFTANEMAAFNQREYCKAQGTASKRGSCDALGVKYIDGHVPRFYQMRSGTDIYRCAHGSDASECRSYGDPAKGNTSTEANYYAGANYTRIDLNEFPGAKVMNLSPTANWLADASSTDGRDSDLKVKDMWVSNVENNSSRNGSTGKALQIDGTIYSANAIFGIGSSRSQTNGSMTVNGSIISADLGMLITGDDGQQWGTHTVNMNNNNNSGLRVHYDERLNELLGIKGSANEGISVTRASFKQLAY